MKKMNNILQKMKTHKIEIAVIILLFGAKFLGFIKNVFMAKYYGASTISDAYQMATSIPMIVLGVILYSYQAFTKGYFIAEKGNRVKQYISTFLNFILVLLFIVSVFLFIFPKEITSLFAPGFNDAQFEYTLNFLGPIILGTIFLAVANILAEYLRCKNSYIVAQAAYLIINIVEIITIFVAYQFDYMWLSYGYFVANFGYFIILAIVCLKKGIKYSPAIFERKEFKTFIKILIPIFLSSIITDVNSMVDKIFASNFETGIVSTLSYSTNIKTVSLIIAAGYLTVLFPKISKKMVEKKYNEFNRNIRESLIIILLIYIPITIFIIAFSNIIVRLVYYRGAFDSMALQRTSECLIMYTIGIAGISIRDLYIKALYCLERGKEVIFVSVVSVGFNIILNIILSSQIGYIGLPLATSLSVWLILPLLIYIYHKNVKKYLNVKNERNDN